MYYLFFNEYYILNESFINNDYSFKRILSHHCPRCRTQFRFKRSLPVPHNTGTPCEWDDSVSCVYDVS